MLAALLGPTISMWAATIGEIKHAAVFWIKCYTISNFVLEYE